MVSGGGDGRVGVAAQDLAQPAARRHPHLVLPERSRYRGVPVVADDVGQVLVQAAAPGHVDDLHAPADAEHRKLQRGRGVQQRELGGIALRAHAGELRQGLGTVAGRVDVPAPGEHEPVQPRQRVLDTGHRRQQHRDPAGRRDGVSVAARQDHGLPFPDAPARPLTVGADPDQRGARAVTHPMNFPTEVSRKHRRYRRPPGTAKP